MAKQVVLPAAGREDIMTELHDAPLRGHRGIKYTFSRLPWQLLCIGMVSVRMLDGGVRLALFVNSASQEI